MKGSDLFVRCLENEGVRTIFGVPGEENLDLLESISRSKIKLVLTRHEQGAGFMAAIHGRLTGQAGVCLATLGPGATNLVTAGAYAQLGAMPIVMITGQKPIKSSKQGQFQIIDVVDMMTPITKTTQQIHSATLIPSAVRNAFARAEDERPGATHLELPEDIARETSDASPIPPTSPRRPIVETKAVQQATDLIKASRHPLLLIGAGANRKRTCKMLRELVERWQIPFVTTQMGKGVVDETSPLFVGNAAVSSGDFVHRAFEAADLIINVGHDVVEKPPFLMEGQTKQVVHINFLPAQTDPVYFPQIELIGDIANSIWQLRERMGEPPAWDFSAFAKVAAAQRENTQQDARDDRFPVLPQHLVQVIREIMPDDGIVALDNGIYKIWFARNYPAREPNTVLLDNALATMGAGLPSAMGAKLTHPDRPIMAVCGDGGFMMNSQELETAVRLKLDLVVLIINDSAYGMIRWKQADMDFKDFGLQFGNPDFVTYAQSYGATGHRIEETAALAPTIAAALQAGGVHVIDLPIDYSENGSELFENVPTAAAKLEI
jgi:acetolactate synthase I/II/III large subunit